MADAEAKPSAYLGPARVVFGLVQGAALFGLHRAEVDGGWPSGSTPIFCALALIWTFVPLILIGGLGAIRARVLAIWAVAATVVLGVVGLHDGANAEDYQTWPHPTAFFAGAAITFIGHHLVAAGDEARRWIAPYERYFDLGWRHAAQLVLSCAFTGGLWILLYLGAALFEVIKITALRELIGKDWFYYPVTTMAFATAIHLTDLRSALVRGFRALSLMLLSWLMPVFTLLGGAFLLALPFTGLGPLWETRAAGAILLSAAANLIILINAAYQDGGEETSKASVLRWAARVAGVLLAPLVILAGVALWLRLDQHGLSPERVLAAACILVGAVYAGFYLAAAFRKPWMKLIERANIYAAFLILAVLVAVFTPIADPVRLSVDDQLGRLRRGAVSAADFDYAFLRFESGRYGQAALQRLRADRSTEQAREIASNADAAMTYESVWEARRRRREEAREEFEGETRAPTSELRLELARGSQPLPASFSAALDQLNVGDLGRCRTERVVCEAVVLNMDEEPGLEILIRAADRLSLLDEVDGQWSEVGNARLCPGGVRQGVRDGVTTAPPQYNDVIIGERRVRMRLLPGGCQS